MRGDTTATQRGLTHFRRALRTAAIPAPAGVPRPHPRAVAAGAFITGGPAIGRRFVNQRGTS